MIDDIERGFLDLLGPDDYAALLELGVRRRFPSGTALALGGDPSHEVFILLKGLVKVSVSSVDSREVVLDVVEARTLLGEVSAVDGGQRSAALTALSAIEVACIPTAAFNTFLDATPNALRYLLVDVASRLRRRIQALQSLRQLGWVENTGADIVIRDLDRVRGRAVR
ncbi:Crp/Fnr family transcriptional regulator [Sporichthya sp.]|uniref:Crp/Fnr family transcriptional regulator n=1 Tax=Sporichthya sp. TaxID=65475 RepID=UPI001798664E|nr:cyclic nucleotide-binding domain-containing protein [Sporichthya sp.]MBA3745254.1 cyclic nucleotide-binding domain-containing protein [Sporichthya sp.]